jgi:hypothetical protein
LRSYDLIVLPSMLKKHNLMRWFWKLSFQFRKFLCPENGDFLVTIESSLHRCQEIITYITFLLCLFKKIRRTTLRSS